MHQLSRAFSKIQNLLAKGALFISYTNVRGLNLTGTVHLKHPANLMADQVRKKPLLK